MWAEGTVNKGIWHTKDEEKNLEKNVERLIQSKDTNFLSKIADYIPLQQVQINLPSGGFTVGDNVWIWSDWYSKRIILK